MATDVVGSKMPSLASDALKPSKAGYGQNGYAGASSDLPGENTTSGFLPQTNLADGNKANVQNRTVKSDPYPTTFGMHKPS